MYFIYDTTSTQGMDKEIAYTSHEVQNWYER